MVKYYALRNAVYCNIYDDKGLLYWIIWCTGISAYVIGKYETGSSEFPLLITMTRANSTESSDALEPQYPIQQITKPNFQSLVYWYWITL